MAIDINIPSQVKNYANLAGFPVTGSLKTIFIAEDTNKTYRWTGSAYVEISASQAAAWGTITGTLSTQTDLQTALNGKVPTTRTLTINGTTQDLSADRTFTISTGITIGTTAITSGTVGRVLFEGTGNVVQESANLFWDNTNGRLGVGTSSPAFKADIIGTGRINNLTIGDGTYRGTSITFASLAGGAEKKGIFFDGGAKAYYQQTTNLLALESPYNGGALALSFDGNTNNVNFYNQSGTILSKIFAGTGNWGINTTTDAGFKLDVNGTARIDQTLTVNGTGSGTAITFGGNIGRFTIDGSFIRFKTVNGGDMLNMTANFLGIFETSVVPSAVVSIASTTRGFLPPRMTTTQKNAIATPATGLMVYDTTLNLMALYNGTVWTTL